MTATNALEAIAATNALEAKTAAAPSTVMAMTGPAAAVPAKKSMTVTQYKSRKQSNDIFTRSSMADSIALQFSLSSCHGMVGYIATTLTRGSAT